ncbi:MAG: hypothetical protein ACUVYA_13650 [Planctomycetota bacterium]
MTPWRERWDGSSNLGWRPFPRGSLEQAVFRFLAEERWEARRTRETLSDETGAFRFEGLPESTEYLIAAESTGWAIRPFQGANQCVFPGDQVAFLASEAGEQPSGTRISFLFLLPDGTEFEEGILEIQNLGSVRGRVVSAPWRRSEPVVLEAGVHIIQARAEHRGELYCSDPVVVAVPRNENGAIALELRIAAGIYGEVLVPSESTIEDVPVYLRRVFRGQRPPSLDWSVTGKPVSRGSGFRYSFQDLPPGLYHLAATWGPRGTIAAEALVEVGEEPVRQDLELRSPEAGLGFVIRALDPGGDPVPFCASMETYQRKEARAWSGNTIDLRSAPGEDGAPRFLPTRALDSIDTREAAGWILRLFAGSYGWLCRPIDPWREREVSVRFEEPATLAVTIEGYRESKYPRGEVTLELHATLDAPDGPLEYERVAWERPDDAGRALFRIVQPGRYVLRASFDFGPQGFVVSQEAHRSTVDLRSGPNEVSVRLALLCDLVVRCPGGEEGDTLVLCRQGRVSGWSRALGEDGTAAFPGIPEGAYTLRLEGPRGGEMDVTVLGSEEVEFRPEPFTALRIRWMRQESYAAEVRLSVFDRIVGAGHALFEDPGDLERTLEASRDREQVYLLVDSWRGRRAVPVNPEKFLGGIGHTFSLVPTRR